jgi:hypothetical protein
MEELDFLFRFILPKFPTTTSDITKENSSMVLNEFKVFYSDVKFGQKTYEFLHVAIFYRLKFILLYWIPYNRCVVELKRKSDKFDLSEIDADVKFLDDLNANINKLLLNIENSTFNRASENDIPALFENVDAGDVAFGRKEHLVLFLRHVGLGTISVKDVKKDNNVNVTYIPMKPFADDKMEYFSQYPEITNTDFGKYALKYPIPLLFILRPYILKGVDASTPVGVVKTPSEDVEIPDDDDVEIFVPVMGEEVDQLITVWELLKEKNTNKRLEMMVNEFIKERIGVIKEMNASKNNVYYNPFDRTIQNPYKLTNEIRKLDQNGPTQNIEAVEESTEKQENVEAEEEPNEKQESTNKIEQTQNAEAEEESTEKQENVEAEEESTEKQENDEDDNSTVATDVQPANQGLISTITNFVIPTSKPPKKMKKKTKS